MRVFASIRGRPTWITGWPHSGWRGADPSTPGAKVMPFGFDITEDGSGDYLLAYFSNDGVYVADSWHPTLADAYASADQRFGVRRHEWGPARSTR